MCKVIGVLRVVEPNLSSGFSECRIVSVASVPSMTQLHQSSMRSDDR